MENCWSVDSIFTWESCKLSSILNIECRMPSRPWFAVKSLRTETTAIVSWNEYFLITDRLSLADDEIYSIIFNDWMISHFQKRILISACEPCSWLPNIYWSPWWSNNSELRCHVRGVKIYSMLWSKSSKVTGNASSKKCFDMKLTAYHCTLIRIA